MTLRYMTGETMMEEDRHNCRRCDSYRGYVCAEHREPSYDTLKQRLAAAEALLREAIRCNRLTLPDDWWTRARELTKTEE